MFDRIIQLIRTFFSFSTPNEFQDQDLEAFALLDNASRFGAKAAQERWAGYLKQSRFSNDFTTLVLQLRELSEASSLSDEEYFFRIHDQHALMDLLLMRKWQPPFEVFCSFIHPEALTRHFSRKVPLLSQWAIGALGKNPLLRSKFPEAVRMVKSGGFLAKTASKTLLAEAIELGDIQSAAEDTQTWGTLNPNDLPDIFEALATRKENGLNEGLNVDSLEALIAAAGGIDALASALETLSGSQLAKAIHFLIKALKQGQATEKALKVMQEKISTQKTQRLIEASIEAAGAALNRPGLLSKILQNIKDPTVVQHILIEINKTSLPVASGKGISLHEIAWLSKSTETLLALQMAGASGVISKERQQELIKTIELAADQMIQLKAQNQINKANGSKFQSNQSLKKEQIQWREALDVWKTTLPEGQQTWKNLTKIHQSIKENNTPSSFKR